MKKLIIQTLETTLIGAIGLGVLLFIPAGTLSYWQAWVFMIVFIASVQTIGVYLSLKDPELLERRKNAGPKSEQRPAQRIIIYLAIASFLAMMLFPAFDHRFGWSHVPWYVSLVGDALVALGLFENLIVLRENRFAASNVQTFDDQRVISTGLYSIVRHPMYSGALVMSAGVPLALGSLWGLAFLAITFPVLVWRILDEEKMLAHDLAGYSEYARRVRYRLVPHLW